MGKSARAIEAIIAGLAGGAQSLGASLQAKARDDRALKRVTPPKDPTTVIERTIISPVDGSVWNVFGDGTAQRAMVRPESQPPEIPNVQGASEEDRPEAPGLRLGVKPTATTRPAAPPRRQLVRSKDNQMVSVDPDTGLDPEGQPVEAYQPPKDPGGGPSKAPTEAQEKSFLYWKLMKDSEPEIQSAIGSGKIRPAAVTAYLNAGPGAPIVNMALNAEEQRLIRAGKTFARGANRKESGAAISNTEIREALEAYFPGLLGDKPELAEAKNASRAEYMETMRALAAPAIQYYEANAPAAPQSSPKASLAERVRQLKSEGKSKDEAKAILRREGYEVP